MTSDQYWPLVTEVLQTGPADGRDILQHAKTVNLWEALYLASRSSPYAPTWREAFGRQRDSQHGVRSILELVVAVLIDQTDLLKSQQPPEQERMQSTLLLARLLANCCADNDHNRRTVIHAGGLSPLIKLLEAGCDPNVLVPTVYNVCADLEDPTEEIMSDADTSEHRITVAEERLARKDVSSNGIYSGILAFLSPAVVLRCNDDIKEYLADLVEMSATPATVVQEGLADTRGDDIGHAFTRLLASDGGQLLADHCAKCRCNIARSLLAISTSDAPKAILASTGDIFAVALMAEHSTADLEYFGEDEEEEQDNREALETIKTASLKLVYEVCQLPQFASPPKYGTARHSLDIICHATAWSPYALSIANIILYGFVDSDVRAHLLVSENLLPPLIEILAYETDKTVIHPALALATKLAITWPLRADLHRANAMRAARHLLTATNLGYEIPLNTVTFLEIMIKGHSMHISAMMDKTGGQSMMDDVFALFAKGQDAICLEIGRLVIEICATLAQQGDQELAATNAGLDEFASSCKPDALAGVLVYMASKAQSEVPAVAQRVWFVLGLLSTTPSGRTVVHLVLQDANVQLEVRKIGIEDGSWVAGNIKFMMHNLGSSLPQITNGSAGALHTAMDQISLG
ncbi:hypothetical protein OHC33_007005 [Knufia fluminis]|uniref:ARM repeat-containing protein n=1 Tax=Knufia fluminis TaxID=191047 RepID=A0AAN8EI91_9EURO|nr:hypothetical protein OHC33_007005 [Knufia fluminis]